MTRRLLLRLSAVGGLVALYYSADWSTLQRVVAAGVAGLLQRLGHAVTLDLRALDPVLRVGGWGFTVTANCTYADLVLTLAPLCWRGARSLRANVSTIAAIAAVVLPLNVARVAFAIHWVLGGVPWTWVHTVPDLTIHAAAIALAAVAAMKGDRREVPAPRAVESSGPAAPAGM